MSGAIWNSLGRFLDLAGWASYAKIIEIEEDGSYGFA
jgi:hypothetical protein